MLEKGESQSPSVPDPGRGSGHPRCGALVSDTHLSPAVGKPTKGLMGVRPKRPEGARWRSSVKRVEGSTRMAVGAVNGRTPITSSISGL